MLRPENRGDPRHLVFRKLIDDVPKVGIDGCRVAHESHTSSLEEA